MRNEAEMVKLLVSMVKLMEAAEITESAPYNNGMIGKYVIVRCRDAGVHAGVLQSHQGRECVLTEARRLWRWKPARGGLLSSVSQHGLQEEESIVGEPQDRLHLTENCEIAQCTPEAEAAIRRLPNSHD